MDGTVVAGERVARATLTPQEYLATLPYDTTAPAEFGGKLADSIGADLSSERTEDDKLARQREEEEAMAAAARPIDWRARVEAMSFEERVEATLACLGRKNNQKEILYDLLLLCREEQDEEDVLAFLEGHKQFADGYHSAQKYLFFLQRTGGIDELEYDAEDELVTVERCQELLDAGASPEEVEDLTVVWRYRTTPAGEEAARRFDPAVRTREMLASQKPTRLPSYRRLLAFCDRPRSLDEICEFMAGDAGLEIDPRTGVTGMQPSAYIGKLDAAGALTWDGGWKTTPQGMEVLETIPMD